MSNGKIIGLSAKLRHGKDTFADMMIGEYKLSTNDDLILKIGFADPIKKALKIIIPSIKDEWLWGSSENRGKIIEGYANPNTGGPLTVRDCLVAIGKWGRKCNVDCWVIAAMETVKMYRSLGYHVIINDCRFKNEKKAIEEALFYTGLLIGFLIDHIQILI